MSELQKIETLDRYPFKNMVASIGNLPTSFVDSMSYYEMLAWLCQYIQDKIIPTVNENAEAVEELQSLYVELKQYVDDYFENLDVQEEINNKLDEMAESGELADIISIYLNSAALISFDTVSDMKGADNLREGSNIRTDGYSTYSDGKGSFYRVRTLTSGDTIDEINIIALTNYPTLIAEKLNSGLSYVMGFDKVLDMKNSTALYNGMYVRTYGKTNLNDTFGAYYKIRTKGQAETPDEENVVALSDSTLVAEKMREPFITIFVGDSYGMLTNNWVEPYCTYNGLTLGSDAINLCAGNAGFQDIYGGTNDFLHNLQNGTESIDKNMVKKIIVCGGYNDRTQSRTQLEDLISTFATYVKANFKNADCYVGMIGNEGAVDATRGGTVNYREWIVTQVLRGYRTCVKYGLKYLNGVENVMHNYQLFASDYVHPNADGCAELAKAISIAETGNYEFSSGAYEGCTLSTDTITKANDVYAININLIGYIQANTMQFRVSGSLTFTGNKLMNDTDTSIQATLGTYDGSLPHFRYTNYLSTVPVKMRADIYNGTKHPIYDGFLKFNGDGSIVLEIDNNLPDASRYIHALTFLSEPVSMPLLMQ